MQPSPTVIESEFELRVPKPSDPCKAPVIAAGASIKPRTEYPALTRAIQEYEKHVVTPDCGRWLDDSETIDVTDAATRVRILGTGNTLASASQQLNAHYQASGYRKLADEIRGRHQGIKRVRTDEESAHEQVRFAAATEFRTFAIPADQRITLGSFWERLGLAEGMGMSLVTTSLFNQTAFILRKVSSSDTSLPIVTCVSKKQLAFKQAACKAMAAEWSGGDQGAQIQIAILGPSLGQDIAMILKADALTEVINKLMKGNINE